MSLIRRTNACINPSFEVDVTTGTTATVATTLAQSSTQAQFGTFSCRATSTGGTSAGMNLSGFSIPGAATVRISLYAFIPSANVGLLGRIRCQVRDVGTNLATLDFITSTEDAWTRATMTATTIPVGNTFTNMNVFALPTAGSWTSGDLFYFDGVLVETATGVLDSYFDGSTPGDSLYEYAWTGAADASSSTASAKLPVKLNQPGLTQSAVRAATI